MNEPYLIVAAESANSDDAAIVRRGLGHYNREIGGMGNFKEVALFLKDAAGHTLGGLLGYSLGTWLHIETLWLTKVARGGGYGTALLRAAKDEGRKRGCRVVDLATFDYQAPGFYLRRDTRSLAG